MSKFALAGLLALVSFTTLASTFECRWKNEGITQGPNYFQPSSFNLTINADSVEIDNDTFFSRDYSPCWTGGFESCKFNFELPAEALRIVDQSAKQIALEFVSIDEYGSGMLDLNFAKPIKTVRIGQSVRTTIAGDDGDGTFLDDSIFECKRLK